MDNLNLNDGNVCASILVDYAYYLAEIEKAEKVYLEECLQLKGSPLHTPNSLQVAYNDLLHFRAQKARLEIIIDKFPL